MTDRTRKPLLFSSVKSKRTRQLQAVFDQEGVTSDAGALLLREVDEHIGLTDKLAGAMGDPRQQGKVTHSARDLLRQRIYAIALGYEDINDHRELRHDAALQVAVDRESEDDENEPLASPSTLCRLEKGAERGGMLAMAEALVSTFIESRDEPPEELVLDFDATEDPLHGMQEGRFFNGYYDCYCYLPLYVFCGHELLVAYLRPSNCDQALHSRIIAKFLTRAFRKAWPEVKITLRGDCGFRRRKLMRWCEKNGVNYILGMGHNAVLEREAKGWMDEAVEMMKATGEAARVFGEFSYAAKDWKVSRRVIAKAEALPDKENHRYIVTNLDGDPRYLYEDVYCLRGDMENRIKEQQRGLYADRLSCRAFRANQFRLLLSSAAYVLLQALRRQGLVGTELEKAQVGTIRLKLLKIGGRVTRSVRRIVFHLPRSYPFKGVFSTILSRVGATRRLASGFG